MTGLLLDEMYPPALARRLRDLGHDALAALDMEVGLASRSDEDVLAWATRHDRVVVTENIRDFARLAQTTPHAGIILVSAQRFPRTRSGLDRLASALDHLLSEKTLPPPDAVTWLRTPG